MHRFNKIILGNKIWSNEKKQLDPDYFTKLSMDQRPDYLWIGCSDSRVPANEITNTEPGEMFVHRNIANLVVNTDLNVMSVLQYAVEHLHVSHIIVCGHYGCGGLKAGMTNKDFGLLNRWIMQIKDIYMRHQAELEKEPDMDVRANKLAEHVAREQLYNIAKTSVVQNAWKTRKFPYLHACIYDMNDGVINVLKTIDPNNPGLPELYMLQ